jgi:hypothetical protein
LAFGQRQQMRGLVQSKASQRGRMLIQARCNFRGSGRSTDPDRVAPLHALLPSQKNARAISKTL